MRKLLLSILFLVLAVTVAAEGASGSSPDDAEDLAKVDKEEQERIRQIDEELGGEKLHVAAGFWPATFSSLSIILVSEIGDKTFFIAAILAMRHPRLVIFSGAIGALALMTILSAAVGYAVPTLLPRTYTHYAAMVLFAYFGVKLLREAWKMDGTEGNEELEEVSQTLKEDEATQEGDEEAGVAKSKPPLEKPWYLQLLSPVLLQSFTLTFLAEWGDRSQIATIVLAAAKDPVGVTLGGICGHAFCTGMAVIGGRLLAQRISVRTVNFGGGALFLLFAIVSLYQGPDSAV